MKNPESKEKVLAASGQDRQLDRMCQPMEDQQLVAWTEAGSYCEVNSSYTLQQHTFKLIIINVTVFNQFQQLFIWCGQIYGAI